MFDVAYGVPERSVSEKQLRSALAFAAEAFDESPTRMHVVLNPPGQGIRWFSFACTVFARGRVLAQGHFSDVLETEVAELIIVARLPGDEPAYCEVLGTRASRRGFFRSDQTIYANPALPPDARKDGELDEIALAALGLPNVRPFAELAKPTHEVVLLGKNVDEAHPIVPFSGPVLPVRVRPRIDSVGGKAFNRMPRKVDTSDLRSMREHVQRVLAKINEERLWTNFDQTVDVYAREVTRVGQAVAPVLVELLAQPKPRPETSQLALTALGNIGMAADAIVPWLARSSETLSLAAFFALARQGEAARPALAIASTSSISSERIAAQALLDILDAADFAPIRAVRSQRDTLDKAARAEITKSFDETYPSPDAPLVDGPARLAWYLREAIGHKALRCLTSGVYQSTNDSIWAVALFLIETPLLTQSRDEVLETAVNRHGTRFSRVANVLLLVPPFADDPMLQALARGKKAPTFIELTAARKKNAAKKPAAKKPVAKKAAAKKPVAREPAAKKPAAEKPVAKKAAGRSRSQK